MKKIILISAVILSAIVFTGYITINQHNKKRMALPVEFSIYKAYNYNAPVYKDAKVSLRITIIAENGNKKELLWQHIYPTRCLSDFPINGNASIQQVNLNQLFGRKENIRVQYELIYNSKGIILQTQNTEILTPHTSDKVVRIAI